jgi:hypothetical protein
MKQGKPRVKGEGMYSKGNNSLREKVDLVSVIVKLGSQLPVISCHRR